MAHFDQFYPVLYLGCARGLAMLFAQAHRALAANTDSGVHVLLFDADTVALPVFENFGQYGFNSPKSCITLEDAPPEEVCPACCIGPV